LAFVFFPVRMLSSTSFSIHLQLPTAYWEPFSPTIFKAIALSVKSSTRKTGEAQ
jgi:hypothetical protein